MGCCGQRRRQHHNAASAGPRRARAAVTRPPRAAKRSSYTYFQYIGKTALTAVGPVSGRTYRFDRPGAVVAVDPRDRRSLAAVPSLTQVATP